MARSKPQPVVPTYFDRACRQLRMADSMMADRLRAYYMLGLDILHGNNRDDFLARVLMGRRKEALAIATKPERDVLPALEYAIEFMSESSKGSIERIEHWIAIGGMAHFVERGRGAPRRALPPSSDRKLPEARP